jgi:acyl-CoA synthetase (NDP forming)
MSGDQSRVQAVFEGVKAAGRIVLTAPEARQVCEAYGLPVPKEGLARSIEEAARLAREIGFPVALKIVSPDIVHKTEAGGVQLGLSNTREVRQAYRTITANAWNYQSDVQITGVRHHSRSGLWPRGHVRSGWGIRRNAAGYDLPSGADDTV